MSSSASWGFVKLRFLLAVAALGIVLALTAILYLDQWQNRPLPLSKTIEIELNPGEPFAKFVAQIEQHAYSGEPLWQRRLQRRLWQVLGMWTGAAQKIQVGEYAIPAGSTPLHVITRLQTGQVIQYEFRIAEGITFTALLKALAQTPKLEHTLPYADPSASCGMLMAELKFAQSFCEGQFFPDTYRYTRQSSDIEILSRAHLKMQAQLAASWQQRDADMALQDSTQALILASIIEKESGLKSDLKTISQVFHNRLRRGMRLQTDPTVIFGVGDAFDGNLTREHLRTDTPYNTYTRHGLPPTPIALPSKVALLAAVQPSAGDYLYFVARGDGTSQFSESLDEHNKAVRKYQLGGKG